jgi:rSAM/selenodomain-associated transferase 1
MCANMSVEKAMRVLKSNAGRIGLGLMCKPPQAGTSKTRLAAYVGADRAAVLAAAFLADAVATIEAAARDSDVSLFAFFKPPGAEDLLRQFVPATIPLVLQDGPDLGAAMFGALWHMLGTCPDGAILIGSDLPTLPAAHVIKAARRLRMMQDGAVFGPASDGGYYLVGIKSARQAPLFQNMTWSTATVMNETRRRAAEHGIAVEDVPEWYDVDDGPSLARLEDDLRSGVGGLGPAAATRRLLGS